MDFKTDVLIAVFFTRA